GRGLEEGGGELAELLAVRRVPRAPRPDEPAFSLLLMLPFAALLSAALAFLLVRLLARRLRALEELAARVATGDLSVRVADPRRDEIGRVAGQFDRMTERLARARGELERH